MDFIVILENILEFIRNYKAFFGMGFVLAYFLAFVVSEIRAAKSSTLAPLVTIRYTLGFFIISYLAVMALFGVFFMLEYYIHENYDFIGQYAYFRSEYSFIEEIIMYSFIFILPIVCVIISFRKLSIRWYLKLPAGLLIGVFVDSIFVYFYDIFVGITLYSIIFVLVRLVRGIYALTVQPFYYFCNEYKFFDISTGLLPNIVFCLIIPYVSSIIWRSIRNYSHGFRLGKSNKNSSYLVFDSKAITNTNAPNTRNTTNNTTTFVTNNLQQGHDNGSISIDDFLSDESFEDLP